MRVGVAARGRKRRYASWRRRADWYRRTAARSRRRRARSASYAYALGELRMMHELSEERLRAQREARVGSPGALALSFAKEFVFRGCAF